VALGRDAGVTSKRRSFPTSAALIFYRKANVS
jgi:hypothetical protein